jgi:hypothetical protein
MTRDGRLSTGDSVIIRQVSRGEIGLLIREIGAGTLVATPEVGSRLRIELRRGRGLASSAVTRLEDLGAGQLAVRTVSRVYVISDIENGQGPDRPQLERVVTSLLDVEATRPPGTSEWETEYVRLQRAEPKEERRVRVTCTREREEELVGEGELLGEIELGESLRFTGRDGRVLATSRVEMVRQSSPSCLEVSTGNSLYRVEFLSGRLPR